MRCTMMTGETSLWARRPRRIEVNGLRDKGVGEVAAPPVGRIE